MFLLINRSLLTYSHAIMGSLVRGVSPINLPPKATPYAEMIYNAPGEAPCGRNSPSPAVMKPQAAAYLP